MMETGKIPPHPPTGSIPPVHNPCYKLMDFAKMPQSITEFKYHLNAMRIVVTLVSIIVLTLSGCSGVDSVVKKSYKNTQNTIGIQDLTAQDFDLLDAGARLQYALEVSLTDSVYRVSPDNPRYRLKYKVMEYNPGSRLGRIATFGLSDSARAHLRVKAALYNGDSMLGAWEVNSWIKGGVTGGSEDEIFLKAAEEIISHLKGDF